ncbi:MAG: imidazoleglycerol-phosphate dehydratase HisB [Spirochaetales bacterium]
MAEEHEKGAHREARVSRTTRETSISIYCNPDAGGEPQISTGVAFFDHMLTALSHHGRLALTVEASGDIEVDPHHLVEDTGLVLGDCLADIATQTPTERFGHAMVPMDDALGEATVDFGGRPYLVYRAEMPQNYAGAFDLNLLREFFYALSTRSKANIHLEARYGLNGHHMAEALFKALGLAIRAALTPRSEGGMSTKGVV